MENENTVLAVFKQEAKPLSSKEVAELSGIDKKDADKLDSPKRCYYQLK